MQVGANSPPPSAQYNYLTVSGKLVPMEVDTGATLSMMPTSIICLHDVRPISLV